MNAPNIGKHFALPVVGIRSKALRPLYRFFCLTIFVRAADSEQKRFSLREDGSTRGNTLPPLIKRCASDHCVDTKMEKERHSLCEIPRGLVVGEVNELFVCGICDGLLWEPRRAGSCSEHLFCRLCYEAALSKEGCCPTCKQPVDASEPLQGFGPFEAMVNGTVVRCPNSNVAGGAVGNNILNAPAKSCEASGSSACSLGSAQAPAVEAEAGDGGSNAPPMNGGGALSEMSSSPFDGIHVGAPPHVLQTCPGHREDPLLNRPVSSLQVTRVDLSALRKMRGFANQSHLRKEELLHKLTPYFKTSKVQLNTSAMHPNTLPPPGLKLFGHTGSRVRAAGGMGRAATKELWRGVAGLHW